MPITDPRISRHILTDEDESDEDEYYKQLRMVGNQDYQPTITIELNDNNMVTSTNANASGTANKIKSIIILPPNLSIIQTELIKLGLVKSIGSISIEFLIYIFMILQIILLLLIERVEERRNSS